MSDLINRQAAIDALAKNMPSLTTPDGCGKFDHDIQVTDEAYVDCMQIIHELPSAQPERIRGRWIEKLHVHGVAYCSLCDYELHTNDTNFCPNCGAKMDEG